MFYNDETNPYTDLTDPHIWWNKVFLQMKAGLIKWSLHRSWIHDSYFSLHRPMV